MIQLADKSGKNQHPISYQIPFPDSNQSIEDSKRKTARKTSTAHLRKDFEFYGYHLVLVLSLPDSLLNYIHT